MESLDTVGDPSWLLDPPSGPLIAPPVSTRPQLLPVASLGWQDFERLCLQLARIEGETEHWQLYGTAGQKQGGIDIYVRSPGKSKYRVWQTKRYQTVSASDLTHAVTAFLKGNWASKSEAFIFCTSASLQRSELADAIEREATRLKAEGITLEVRDAARISNELKAHPELVDDFFDRPWTKLFCGQDAVDALQQRLARVDYGQLRTRLREIYTVHFSAVDPGVLRASGGMANPAQSLPLARRFVPTDFVSTETGRTPTIDDLPPPQLPQEKPWQEGRQSRRAAAFRPALRQVSRIGLEQWSSEAHRSILFGAPGAGKSSLLRFLTLELLSAEPRLPFLKRRWPDHLPLLLSFPYWTRLIEKAGVSASISIPAAISSWLEAHAEPELAKLAKHAFEQRRVLLLVDGVDEWSNEEAAATALTLLQTFAETRDIPVVVTSRPHGARLLGTLDASWKRYAVASLSIPQQVSFARAWYSFLATQDGQGETLSQTRAEAFVSELQSVPDVAALAGVPLLLGGLMALAREGASLPRNRFQAYRELADRLIDQHARARAKASLSANSPQKLDAQTREMAFAELAYAIHAQRSNDSRLDGIEKRAAIGQCQRALQQYLDLPDGEAKQQARNLLHVGAEAIGILVEKSPTEVGFLHRAFQELLAAKYIQGLDVSQQCEIISKHAHDSQWQDILLFVTQFNSRPTEVESIVEAIEGAPAKSEGDWSRTLLLADIAFSEVKRSPALTKRLADTIFSIIESGRDLDQREQLLRKVVGGLASEQAAILIRPKLKMWFPSFHPYSLSQALPIIAKWAEPEIDEILWRNLHSDEQDCRIAAAEELANRHRGSEEWFQKVLSLLKHPPDVTVAASAVTLLHLGWPSRDETKAIIDDAAQSSALEIRVAGLEARVFQGRQSSSERDELIGWLRCDDWSFKRAAGELLGRGWPQDAILKQEILTRLQPQRGNNDEALRIAAEGFPGDLEIADAIAEALNDRGFLSGVSNLIPLLAKNFAGNERLANKLAACRPDDRMDRPFSLFHASKIAATSFIKECMLEDLRHPERLRFWSVDGLLDHWPNDRNVLSALRAVVDWPAQDLGRVADRLPDIFPGEAEYAQGVLRRLLQDCKSDPHIFMSEIIKGLSKYGLLDSDPTLIDEILSVLETRHRELHTVESSHAALLACGSSNSKVRALAVSSLHNRSGLVAAVAAFFGNESELRREVIRVAAPLPLRLRAAIAEALKFHAMEDPWALRLLDEGGFDADVSLGATCVMNAARCHLVSQSVSEEYVEYLENEMSALGPHYGQRRFAGFTSLAIVGQWDRALALLPDETGIGFDISGFYRRSWPDIDLRFSEIWPDALQRLEQRGLASRFKLGPDDIVDRFGHFTESKPSLKKIVDEAALQSLSSASPSISALNYLLHDPANRADVLDKALPLLCNDGSWIDVSTALNAAELIARNFGGSSVVHDQIVALFERRALTGPVSALCDGWPDSPLLDEITADLRSDESLYRSRLHTPVGLKLVATKSPASGVFENLVWASANLTGHIWDGIPHWITTMQRRIRDDEAVRALMFDHLVHTSEASEKVSFASFLAAGSGMRHDLYEWCQNQLVSSGEKLIAECGMDLWVGQPVVVWKRLSDLLRSESRV